MAATIQEYMKQHTRVTITRLGSSCTYTPKTGSPTSVDVLRSEEPDNLTDFDDGAQRVRELTAFIGDDVSFAGIAEPRRGDTILIGSDTWQVKDVTSTPEVGQHRLELKLTADAEKSGAGYRMRR